MQTSRQRTATDGFGPVQNLMQDATFVAMGGERSLAVARTNDCFVQRSKLCEASPQPAAIVADQEMDGIDVFLNRSETTDVVAEDVVGFVVVDG
jgi:hypothetical protein